MSRLAYSISEAAEQIGVSRAHLYTLIARDGIPTVKFGRCRRILHDDLVAYLERHKEPS